MPTLSLYEAAAGHVGLSSPDLMRKLLAQTWKESLVHSAAALQKAKQDILGQL